MIKKSILYLMTLAALFLLASCTQDDDPYAGKVKVTFIAHLPETLSLDSRAIGDGTKANELFFWVYDERNQEVNDMYQHNVQFNNNSTATVSAYLTPGHVYKFAFWAQHKDIQCYDPRAALVDISYSEESDVCNDELRDAFWGWIPDLYVDVAGEITQNIVLTRRLAQVNVGITEIGFNNALAAGVDLRDYDSELIIDQAGTNPLAYTKFDVRQGNASMANVNYAIDYLRFWPAPMPDEKLKIGKNKYFYLAMSYFQPDVLEETTGNVILMLYHKTNPNKVIEIDFSQLGSNIPTFRGTKRTNLILDGITTDVTFNVVIDENFDNLDYNYGPDGNPLGD